MIKNERQYRITRARAESFREAIAKKEHERAKRTLDPILQKAQADALRSQLATLERELREYEQLRTAPPKVLTYESFEDLPRALIQVRIARGWTQKDLADKLGLDEQKIQDYEATRYQRASLARITAIVKALGVAIREEVRLKPV